MFSLHRFCDVLFILLFHLLCFSYGQQASGNQSLLSGIWNSLTTVEQVSTCPGECVHGLTAFFCDKVLDQVNCGDPYLRCCIMNQVPGLQAPPETTVSPTINDNNNNNNEENISYTTVSSPPMISHTTKDSAFSSNDVFYPSESNKNSNNYGDSKDFVTTTTESITESPRPQESPESSNVLTTESSPSNMTSNRCPIPCSKIPENSFCVKNMSDVICPQGEECCLEVESSIDIMTRNLIKLVQETVAKNNTLNIGHKLIEVIDGTNLTSSPSTSGSSHSRTNPSQGLMSSTEIPDTNFSESSIEPSPSPTTTESPLPPCAGSCVVGIFQFLCDSTDHEQYCPNGGTCCVYKEPVTTPPTIGPCQGRCMPVILSGMCNKPAELVLKTTDCSSNTICCADRKGDNYNDDPPMIDEGESNVNPVPEATPRPQYRPIDPIFPGSHPNPQLHPQMSPNNEGHFEDPNPHNNPHHNLHQNPQKNPNNEENYPRNPEFPMLQPPPLLQCRGTCMSTMFRFACFGQNSIYPGFYCASKGQVCCAANSDIEKFEAFLKEQIARRRTEILAQQQEIAKQKEIEKQAEIAKQKNINKQIFKPTMKPQVPISPQQQVTPQPPLIGEQILKPSSPDVIRVDQGVNVIPIQETSMTPHVCGVKGSRRSSRVVGGSDSFPGEWCWQVALVNQNNKYICGGILIDRQWVLTAAHCITPSIRKNEQFYVRIGQYDLTRQTRPPFKVLATFVHHNHNSQSLDNDIALIKLTMPAELSPYTCLVCLPTKAHRRDPGKRCIVTGYGYQHEAGPMALRVRQASVPIVEDNECTAKINNVTERIFALPTSSFCAGGEGGNDACQGDGGSGLVCEDDGYYELAGLVSWGFGCGRPDVPGVYVKVSSFVGWINQIVSTNNQ